MQKNGRGEPVQKKSGSYSTWYIGVLSLGLPRLLWRKMSVESKVLPSISLSQWDLGCPITSPLAS